MSDKPDAGFIAAGRAIAPLVNENMRLRAQLATAREALREISERHASLSIIDTAGLTAMSMGEVARRALAAIDGG